LEQYEAIVAPLIRSLWSLEVYVLWLATCGALNILLKKSSNETGITKSLKASVNGIINTRFSEFFTNDLYLVAFILDNRYSEDEFFIDTAESRKIPSREELASALPAGMTALPSPRMQGVPLYRRIRHFLLCLLKPELARAFKKREPKGAPFTLDVFPWDLDGGAAVAAFEQQFDAFWRREWPFDSASTARSTEPLEYWRQLESHKFSRVLGYLAVKIFSITVNSMVDERTNSMLTWFNSPYRGRQTASSMESMIMIGQWYRQHESEGTARSKKKEQKRPGVKFHDLDKTYLKSVQSRPHPTRTVDDSDSSEDESD
ncbi:hypothetical protein GGX14DRAFT_334690, partial [Mycena pura]